MPSTYRVQIGDTLPKLALRFYGNKAQESLIVSANPSVSQGLVVGDTITIPDDPKLKALDIQQNDSATFDAPYTIRISGRQFTGVSALFVQTSLTTGADYFSFTTVWDEKSDLQKQLFKPFSYNEVWVYLENTLILAGVLENVIYDYDSDKAQIIVAQGRSLPGVLSDVQTSSLPLEFENQNLQQIADKLLSPHGLISTFPQGPGETFERVCQYPEETKFEFLKRLALVRGFLLNSNETGALVFDRPTSTGTPVLTLEDGNFPLVRSTAKYRGDKRFSSFKTLAQTPGVNTTSGESFDSAIKNIGVVRPHISTIGSARVSGAIDSAKWDRARALNNAIEIGAIVTTWEGTSGGLLKKGDTVSLNSPSIRVDSATKMIIKTIEYTWTPTGGKLARLTLVFPETYTLQDRGSYPWD